MHDILHFSHHGRLGSIQLARQPLHREGAETFHTLMDVSHGLDNDGLALFSLHARAVQMAN